MAIVRFDPFREFATVHERLNRVFDDISGRRSDDDVMSRGDWLPAVDVYENDDQNVVLKAELPGVAKEDITLSIENNTLTLKGERKRSHEVKNGQYHRIERAHGGFSRSFSLPSTVNSEKVAADFRDGVLTITLPRKDEAKPRQIDVKVS
ncbi:MAG: Hsp20 family protein [Luteitalea sp.]|nr:Hsp20 family protein [Luteitalea sp.]